MAFDAGFTKAIINELSASVTNARVEKIFQPSKESVLFVLRGERNGADRGETMKLLIDAGSANPRMSLADPVFDNPKVPPMFCMLLRKHLGGARITSVRQIGFDRAAEFEFEARDELGYLTKKYIYAEIMGKFSNLIFCDAEKKDNFSRQDERYHKRQQAPGHSRCALHPAARSGGKTSSVRRD